MSILSFLTDAAGAARQAVNRAGSSNSDDTGVLPFSAVLSQQTRQTVQPSASSANNNAAQQANQTNSSNGSSNSTKSTDNASTGQAGQTAQSGQTGQTGQTNASNKPSKSSNADDGKDEEDDTQTAAAAPGDPAAALAVALAAMNNAPLQTAAPVPATPTGDAVATATDGKPGTGAAITAAVAGAMQAAGAAQLTGQPPAGTDADAKPVTTAANTGAPVKGTVTPATSTTSPTGGISLDTLAKNATTAHAATTPQPAATDAKAATPVAGTDAQAQQRMADALAQAQGNRDAASQAATAATQAAVQAAQSATPAVDAQPQLQAQANLPAALALNARVGTQDWNNQLSQQVVWLSSAHAQTAQLSLNPPDLGPLHVVLNVANDSAQAMFVSQHAAVRDAVQAALPQLRDSLANNGIALGNATVSSDSSQQQAFAQQGANGNGSGNGNGNGNGRGTPGFGQTADDAPIATTVNVPVRASNGFVDTFA